MTLRIPKIASRRLACILACGFAGFAYGQNIWWTARYNDPINGADGAVRNVRDAQDNVYETGLSWSKSNGYDIVTVKYNSAGVRQWVRRWDGPSHLDDTGGPILIDHAGNVVIGGVTYTDATTKDRDYVVLKYDSNGNKLWARTFDGEGAGDDGFSNMAIDSSDNIYVTGESWGLDTHYDFATLKYSPTGVRKWVRLYRGLGGVADDVGTGISVDLGDGSVRVVGRSWDPATGDDYATLKYSATGTLLWAKRLSGSASIGTDLPHGVFTDGSSNTIVFGESDQSASGRGTDWFLVKYDSAGNLLWQRLVNDAWNGNDVARSLVLLPTNELVVCGTIASSIGDLDIGIAKYDASGSLLWSKSWHGLTGSDDIPFTGVQDGTSNTIFVGETRSASGSFDAITVKYGPTGNLVWARRFGTDTTDEFGFGVCCDSADNPIICGYAFRPTPSFDYLLVKYKP